MGKNINIDLQEMGFAVSMRVKLAKDLVQLSRLKSASF
jgi:hypothetical protein